jgi:hypothetical protein
MLAHIQTAIVDKVRKALLSKDQLSLKCSFSPLTINVKKFITSLSFL